MSLRILVLEDDAELCDSMVELLNLEGYPTTGVRSLAGFKAWRANHTCDVLIADRRSRPS